jgi:hypothetical protein
MTKEQSPRLRVPVRFVDGVCEYALGGAIPVKNGTQAELLIPSNSISDNAFLALMEQRGMHKVLDEGTTLIVCLKTKPEAPPADTFQRLLKSREDFRGRLATELFDNWMTANAFVEVTLAGPNAKQSHLFNTNRGGLWLETRGLEPVGLASTTVLLPPAISSEPVASLNHAYTKLSEIFEPWRISHTGNIYFRVLYQEQNGTWYPLDILRNKALEKHEQGIAKKAWEDFMSKMIRKSGNPNRNG